MSGRPQPSRALGALLLLILATVAGLIVGLVIAATAGSGDAAAWIIIILGALGLATTITRREADRRADR